MQKALIIIFLFIGILPGSRLPFGTIQLYCQDYMNIKYSGDTFKYAAIDDITEITFNAGGTEMTVTYTDASSIPEDISTVVEMTFDVGILGGGSPLPVELVSFTAALTNSATVVLNWQTATEVNNYGFEIQRSTVISTEGRNLSGYEGTSTSLSVSWETIGFVDGHGNSNSPKNYSFTDTPEWGTIFEYRLKQIDTDGAFEYSETITVELGLHSEYELKQNYPNPFNPSTVIRYQIPASVIPNPQRGEESSKVSPSGRNDNPTVTLKVYDILGREVATLVNKQQTAGSYSVVFNAAGLTSGIYIYQLTCGEFVSNKKLLLLR